MGKFPWGVEKIIRWDILGQVYLGRDWLTILLEKVILGDHHTVV